MYTSTRDSYESFLRDSVSFEEGERVLKKNRRRRMKTEFLDKETRESHNF
jgi:hypothetical protein